MSKIRSKVISSAMAVVLALGMAPGLAMAAPAENVTGGGASEAITPSLTLGAQSVLSAQSYYNPPIIAAPLDDYSDGKKTEVELEDFSVKAETYYTSSTIKTRFWNAADATELKSLGKDALPKAVDVYISATNLPKIKNADGKEVYRAGIGIPAREGNTYAYGIGSYPGDSAVTFDAANKDGQVEQDGTSYDTFYFDSETNFANAVAYLAVKYKDGNITTYSIDLSEIYVKGQMTRGLYKLSGVATDSGMVNLDMDDSDAYIKVVNAQAKLLIRVYGVDKYDYIWHGEASARPDASATDQMIEGIPVPAESAYTQKGAQKSRVWTDANGAIGAKENKYKAWYYEIPIDQADIDAKSIPYSIRRSSWSPSNASTWMGKDTHEFTFTSYSQVTDGIDLTSGDMYISDIEDIISLTAKVPDNATASDMDAFVAADSAYINLNYSSADQLDRIYLDTILPEVGMKLATADEQIPNVIPPDGTYTFLQNRSSFNYPSIAEGIVSDSLYSGVLVVKNGKMNITVSQRRGTYACLYLGIPIQAKTEQTAAGGKFADMPNAIDYQGETEVYLDHAKNTIGPDGKGERAEDTAGLYKMYTATFELKSLEKPIAMSMITGETSNWYNRSFIFHSDNMALSNAVSLAREVNLLMDDPADAAVKTRINAWGLTEEKTAAIKAVQAKYEALSNAEKAGFDSLAVNADATEPYGKVLKEAVLAVGASDPIDNNTTVADGTYTDKKTATFTAAGTGDGAAWTMDSLSVAGGKATAKITDTTGKYTELKLNGQTYADESTETGKTIFTIPVAFKGATSFIAKFSDTTSSGKSYDNSASFDLNLVGAPNKIEATAKGLVGTYSTVAATLANPLAISKATGAVTYALAAPAPNFSVDAKTGKITVAKGTAVGTYTVKITATAAGDELTEAGSVTKDVKVTINKAKNAFKVKPAKKKIAVKAGKTVAAKKVFKVTQNASKGKVTYKKLKGNKKITVNASNGKLKVKKGLKKGTYPVKVKLTSKATSNYLAGTATVSFKVKVK